MGYKQIEPNMTFASVIDWLQVEEILMAHYTVGGSREGPTPILR